VPLEPIYQHSVEFVLSGSYLDILAYLQQVEALPILLYWGDVRLAVTAHPRASLAAVVHTFSHAAAVEFQ
jgi:MSHA biogenesis protein MshJ